MNPYATLRSFAALFMAPILIGQTAAGAVIPKAEPNNSFAQAQHVDAAFTTGLQYGVENSATWRWASVVASGNATEEYYAFTVPTGGAQVILDIDFSSGGLTTILRLFNPSQVQISGANGTGGDPGSLLGESSVLTGDARIARTGTLALAAGTYFVSVRGNGNALVQSGQGYTLNVSMLPNIQPLIANAGADFSVSEGDPAFLNASASSGQAPLTYSWTQIGGTPVALADANSATPSFVAPEVGIAGGTLSFLLTLGSGTSTATDTVNVTVLNVSRPPVANAGADFSVNEGETAFLDAGGSVGEGALTYSWSQIGGTPVALAGSDSPTPSFVAPEVAVGGETLSFQLTVGSGVLASTDTVNVTVVNVPRPPVADAGLDFSVNEGDAVFLSGGASVGEEALSFSWLQVGGTPVVLAGANTVSPSFVAPDVAIGGETLSFLLTVGSGGMTATDTVSVTVVNVNHPPVADAGPDQTVAEGSPVTLQGEQSFDNDNDQFTYTWLQVEGPAVALSGADTANPTFEAPYAGISGEPGVVATLTFQLLVDDGFPMDAPAPGYEFDNVLDTVTIEITNTNNLPVADVGEDQTVNENTAVSLSGAGSSDPDGDALTYSWIQEAGGVPVTLIGADTATPSFLSPSVSGTAVLKFTLTVDDGYGGTNTSSVTVNVLDSTHPPLVDAARPSVGELWPPNHQMVSVGITGVTAEDSNFTIRITGVRQDEPTDGTGDGDTAADAVIGADGTVLLRSERAGKGNGRVYHVHFTATNAGGSVSGTVKVTVPHSKKKAAIDGGGLFDSTR